jgi:hypothetical protein
VDECGRLVRPESTQQQQQTLNPAVPVLQRFGVSARRETRGRGGALT